MPRWTIADFAALQIRAVTVPIYPTNTPEQAAYILQNADVKVVLWVSRHNLMLHSANLNNAQSCV